MTSDSASRATRSSRNLRLALALFMGGLAAVTALRAQETPKAPSSTTASQQQAPPANEAAAEAPAPAAAAPARKAESGNAKPAPADDADRKSGKVGTASGRFEPTEKVRADFDVSFPVDI
jgi:hypothetical protein